MTRWHPITKMIVGIASVGLPYLVWNSPSEAPAAVAVSNHATPIGNEFAFSPQSLEALPLRQLPPISQFIAMIERPLFSPTRRPRALEVEANIEVPIEAAPKIRLVGTVSHNEKMTALVLIDENPLTTEVNIGDEISGWLVTSVKSKEITVQRSNESILFKIFDSKSETARSQIEQ